MHRTRWLPPPTPPSQRRNQTWAHMLLSLIIWICVSATLRYGYYGDSCLVLGPSSSRFIKASSVFVKRVEVTNKYNNEVLLYAFNEKPELSSRTNWTVSNFLVVASYSRQGFSLWLNKGSTIRMRWEAQARSLNHLRGIVIKGDRKFEKLQPKQTLFPDAVTVLETVNGNEAEYDVEEDDRYHIGILNMNDRSIILTRNVNVSAKIYDITKAKNMCSTANGKCRLSLPFPNTNYVILTAPNNGDVGGWLVDVSFVARVVTYMLLLGFIMIVVFLILKCLGAFDDDNQNTDVIVDTYRANNSNIVATQTETEPMMHEKPNRLTYGTNDDGDEESGASSSSSEELYDEKLCVICYDEQRNSFFVPCGHCATCYDCAQRIVDGESKLCPICRRLIHKVRRLFNN